MKRITLELTDAEARAIMKSAGLHSGHGIRIPKPLQSANMKLIGAVSESLQPEPEATR